MTLLRVRRHGRAYHFFFEEKHFALEPLQVRRITLTTVLTRATGQVRGFVVLVVTLPTGE